MMQNQITLNSKIDHLRVKCYACKKQGHVVNQCNVLHFVPDHEKILKKYEYSHPQERKPFQRRKITRINYGVFKQNKNLESRLKMEENKENEFSSSEEFLEPESEVGSVDFDDSNLSSPQNKTSKIKSESFTEKNKSKISEPKKNVDRSSINSDSALYQASPIIPSKKNEENIKRPSLLDGNEPRSPTIIQKTEIESPEGPLKKDVEADENYLWKVWLFDKVHQFTNYFPMFNCSKIVKDYNKSQSPQHLTNHKKRTKILRKYSEYTLFPAQMYEKIKHKKKKVVNQQVFLLMKILTKLKEINQVLENLYSI